MHFILVNFKMSRARIDNCFDFELARNEKVTAYYDEPIEFTTAGGHVFLCKENS